jgi:hypothetical protein
LRNCGTDDVYEKAVAPLFGNFTKPALFSRIIRQTPEFYFGKDNFQVLSFPFEFSLDWDSFLGALLSSAMTPVEGSPNFGAFEACARQVFERLGKDGWLVSTGETELILGQVSNSYLQVFKALKDSPHI